MTEIELLPEQKRLLTLLVETARNDPKGRRQFGVVNSPHGYMLSHAGLPEKKMKVDYGDIRVLLDYGLLHEIDRPAKHWLDVGIHPNGFSYYEDLRKRDGNPVDQMESEIHRYIDDTDFQRRHPLAYQKWYEAADQLWSSDSESAFTTIGHSCREAMQEFAEDLINEFEPEGAPTNKQSTVARIRAVLEQRADQFGSSERPFLDTLLPYWGTVSDLVQRQEHGGQKEGEPLIWEDARRVVFQALIVMYEIDRALRR